MLAAIKFCVFEVPVMNHLPSCSLGQLGWSPQQWISRWHGPGWHRMSSARIPFYFSIKWFAFQHTLISWRKSLLLSYLYKIGSCYGSGPRKNKVNVIVPRASGGKIKPAVANVRYSGGESYTRNTVLLLNSNSTDICCVMWGCVCRYGCGCWHNREGYVEIGLRWCTGMYVQTAVSLLDFKVHLDDMIYVEKFSKYVAMNQKNYVFYLI